MITVCLEFIGMYCMFIFQDAYLLPSNVVEQRYSYAGALFLAGECCQQRDL